jgi:hypothetical protein
MRARRGAPGRPGRPLLPLAALLFAAGCGMYGDLYLEPEAPEPPARPEVEEREPIVGADETAVPAQPRAEALEDELEETDDPEQPRPPGAPTPPDGEPDSAAGPA